MWWSIEEGPEGDLVALRSGGNKEGGFFTCYVCDEGLQGVGRCGFAVAVVLEGGVGYGLEHGECWCCDRVT